METDVMEVDQPMDAVPDVTKVHDALEAQDQMDAPTPEPDVVNLLVPSEGATWVRVRELTGRDEEALSRVSRSGDNTAFQNALVRRATVEAGIVGETAKPPVEDVVANMTLGDRNIVMQKIREMTFGADVEVIVVCPACGEQAEMVYDVNEAPIKHATRGDKWTVNEDGWSVDFTAPSGRTFTHRWPAVFDQEDAEKIDTRTVDEKNTVYLHRVVFKINGNKPPEEWALDLGLRDRHALIEHIIGDAPGPDYSAVTAPCPNCETSMPVTVMPILLFR